MTEIKPTGVWKSFLLSFTLPVIGGIVVYFRNKVKNKDLANICLTLSIFHSIVSSYLIGLVFGFSLVLLGINIEAIESYGTLISILVALFIFFILMLAFMRVFRANKYKCFIPVWYLGLLGIIYSYRICEKDKPLQQDVGRFFFFQIVASSIAIAPSLNYIMFSTYVGEQVKSFEIIANETVALEPQYYYWVSFYSPLGTNVLEVNFETTDRIRFILLNSSECTKFRKGENYYYYEQRDVIKLNSTYTLTTEGEWCIVLWNILSKPVNAKLEAAIWYKNPKD